MAITKNTAPAVKPAAKPIATKAAPAAKAPAVKAAAKTTEKAPAKEVAAPVEAKAEKAVLPRVNHKDMAVAINEKVKAKGKAIPVALADTVVGCLEEYVAEALAGGNEVQFAFGKFVPVFVEANERPNPQKPGEKVLVAAKTVAKFKASAGLKRTLNAGDEGTEGEEETSGDE